MSSGIWVPGAAGAPPPSVDEFLARVHGQIAAFTEECRCDTAEVICQLHDGRTLRLQSISPAPGLGWVTLRAFPDDEDEPPTDRPLDMAMLPIGSIVRITVRVPERDQRFGFTAPEPAAPASEHAPPAAAEGPPTPA